MVVVMMMMMMMSAGGITPDSSTRDLWQSYQQKHHNITLDGK
jgi:hypothetical protein